MQIILTLALLLGNPPGSAQALTLPQLIAKYEGWGVQNSLTHQLHNPGALSYAGQKGATRGPGGYAKWATDAEGWAALDYDLEAKVKRFHPHTLRQLLRFWDSKRYLGPLAKELGTTPDAEWRFQ